MGFLERQKAKGWAKGIGVPADQIVAMTAATTVAGQKLPFGFECPPGIGALDLATTTQALYIAALRMAQRSLVQVDHLDLFSPRGTKDVRGLWLEADCSDGGQIRLLLSHNVGDSQSISFIEALSSQVDELESTLDDKGLSARGERRERLAAYRARQAERDDRYGQMRADGAFELSAPGWIEGLLENETSVAEGTCLFVSDGVRIQTTIAPFGSMDWATVSDAPKQLQAARPEIFDGNGSIIVEVGIGDGDVDDRYRLVIHPPDLDQAHEWLKHLQRWANLGAGD
jgi:hypothetical protein